MNIHKSNLRMIAIFDKDGNVHFVFSDDTKHSHRILYKSTYEVSKIDRDFNIPIYGRFYTMLYGNSRVPQLIIYGDSSDYGLDKIEYYQNKYEQKLRDYAYMNNWDILFLP